MTKQRSKGITAEPGQYGQLAISPELSNAALLQRHLVIKSQDSDALDAPAIMQALQEQNQQLQGSKPLQYTERVLQSQAISLNNLFVSMAQQATGQQNTRNYEVLMRLALKAQSQCRATLETLANIRQPRPVVIAQQANIAGQQQVNNAVSPHRDADALGDHSREGRLINEGIHQSHRADARQTAI